MNGARPPGGPTGLRWLITLVGLLALSGTIVAADPQAGPARATGCTESSGVTVVVDFSAFGSGTTVACAPGDPASGLAALQGAGFTVTGTARFGLAFVCRIDNLPSPADDACVITPPATAFWSYWHGTAQGTWSFSSLGAASFDPAPGSVEGWAFGAGDPPNMPPP